MFETPKPTEQERETVNRVEHKIEKVIQVLREGFDGNDLVILKRVNPLRANVLADQLALIETAVHQMRLACAAAGVIGGFTLAPNASGNRV